MTTKILDTIILRDKSIHAKPVRPADKHIRAIFAGRLLFLSILLAAAAVLCVFAHRILSESETELANRQFDAVAERALQDALAITERRRMAAVTMASIVAVKFPNTTQWPFVGLTQFDRISSNLIEASSSVDMAFAPLVRRKDQVAFEEFAYEYFDQKIITKTGQNPNEFFGKGIWTYNFTYFSANTIELYNATNPPLGSIYHDVDASGGDDLMFPLMNIVPASLAMMNLYSPWASEPFDSVVNCSEQRALRNDFETVHCTYISPPARIFRHENRRGALIIEPIYPANDPTVLAGVIISTLLFDELLNNMFSDQVSGIDCVIRTENFAVTYSIEMGEATFQSIQTHEEYMNAKRSNSRKETKLLTPHSMYNEFAPNYVIEICPNDAIYAFYQTNNPAIAVIGVIGIVLGMSLAFLVYDFLVRREFTAKKELLQAKRHFMRYVSHEVRTPLNAVYLGLQVMHSELAARLGSQSKIQTYPLYGRSASMGCTGNNQQSSLNEDWLALTKEIQTNVQGAISVLNDLLNYDKIEQGSMRLDLSLINPWQQIEAIYKEFNLAAKEKQLAYELFFSVKRNDKDGDVYQLAELLPDEMQCFHVVGDKIRLAQVLRNLISNSLKFTPERGCLRIFVTLVLNDCELKKEPECLPQKDGPGLKARRAGKLVVSVEDSGAGMDADQLSKLFKEGVQFNPNELQMGQGSGLGLFIAKGIVEQHGGTLSAKSEGFNMGSIFTLCLNTWQMLDPFDSQDLTSGKIPERQSTSSSPSDSTEESVTKRVSLRVLVVDDVLSNRKLLARLLSREGHICELAEDGQVAVRMVLEAINSRSPYDAILMDYEMPVMNGPAAAEELRRRGLDVHIVGVTGNMLPVDVEYYVKCGADAVLGKPLNLSDLEDLWIQSGVLRH